MPKIMQCNRCGKVFFSEYYRGGYIDHKNMTDNIGCYTTRDDIVRAIVFHGNEIRESEDIRARLACAMTWNEVDESTRDDVFLLVEDILAAISERKEAAKELASSISWEDACFLIGLLQAKAGYMEPSMSCGSWVRNKFGI